MKKVLRDGFVVLSEEYIIKLESKIECVHSSLNSKSCIIESAMRFHNYIRREIGLGQICDQGKIFTLGQIQDKATDVHQDKTRPCETVTLNLYETLLSFCNSHFV